MAVHRFCYLSGFHGKQKVCLVGKVERSYAVRHQKHRCPSRGRSFNQSNIADIVV